MNLVDANVLLYATNSAQPRHDEARTCLERQLNGASTVGFSWVVLLAFLRLSTRPGIFPVPLPVDGALDRIDGWLARPHERRARADH